MRPRITSQRSCAGFTLVEGVAALGLTAILTGTLAPMLLESLDNSEAARAKCDIQVIGAAILSQYKDTGCRPQTSLGPNGATGAGMAIWKSGGDDPMGVKLNPSNTLENLLAQPDSSQASQDLFFAPAGSVRPNREFSYKGPYFSLDEANKTDPWGNAYLVLGYNAAGQNHKGCLWVVSCGPDKGTEGVNLTGLPYRWDKSGLGADDITLRLY